MKNRFFLILSIITLLTTIRLQSQSSGAIEYTLITKDLPCDFDSREAIPILENSEMENIITEDASGIPSEIPFYILALIVVVVGLVDRKNKEWDLET